MYNCINTVRHRQQ